jgi:hypothetical protein
MADTRILAKTAFSYVSKGQIPPTDLLKLLVSKARLKAGRVLSSCLYSSLSSTQ